MTDLISIVKMVGAWVIEVDGHFHQSQPKQAGVEVYIALRVTCNGGHVMDAEQICALGLSPLLLSAAGQANSSITWSI